MAESPQLRVEGELAWLELATPPQNRMDAAFFAVFGRLVREELPGLAVQGLVLCGQGRHFSSGAPIDELRAAGPDREGLQAASASLRALGGLPYPVVAAISGCCLGSGLELALACHYRLAGSGAVFALPEVQFGLMPGCGGCLRLPARVGLAAALELILSGRSLGAQEAHELGLVEAVLPRRQLHKAAARLLRNLGRGPGVF